MTREELKNKRLEIDKLFGTKDYTELRLKRNAIGLIEWYECKTDKRQKSIYKYPILYLKNNKYYLTETFIIVPKWEELSKEQSRFETYIDNLFDNLFKDEKIKIVELLTDNDDTMQEFGDEFIPNMIKLKEKYNITEILMDGYHGLRTGIVENPIPWEYEVP
jgi:hypothetical protein